MTSVTQEVPATVERPAPGWWIAVVGGMCTLGLVAHGPAWRWWAGHVTGAVPRRAYQAVFWAAVATHAAEAAVAVRRAGRTGTPTSRRGWAVQTLVLGYPSLRLVSDRRAPRPPATRPPAP